ncbi:MAG: 7-cyano-7-deazaguanine synthase QueC [Candidatus Cloacimonadota bacterium]|nr:MAG: 7-cyano-7-deazaguanine synthase QueC [Candidatus Cloacimonadota bacterium]
MNQKAVVLVSGGLDSCVTAAIAYQDYQLCFLHINYNQRTEEKELISFQEIAEFYNVKERLITKLPFFAQIGGSSLTDTNISIPIYNKNEGNIPNTYVSFRNAVFLSFAVSWAENIGAKKIFIGAMEQDSSGYPDCTEEFFKKFNQVIKYGTKPKTDIQIITPIIHLKKYEVVKLGKKLNAPLDKTWSCYKNSECACGICDSCLLRIKAFKQAGVKDNIPYAIKVLW